MVTPDPVLKDKTAPAVSVPNPAIPDPGDLTQNPLFVPKPARRDESLSFLDRFDVEATSMPEFPKSTVVTFSILAQKLERYISPADMRKILDAYRFADEKHLGQFRKSGDPYISHPLAVAEICANWKLDTQAIMAALLHDVVEDQGVTLDELVRRFGVPVANMVDGLSKLEKLKFKSHVDAQGENFRKMLLAMARDVRVILVKLADRLHNMRTLDVMNRPKRYRIAKETMEVYVPIAHRLGINNLYREMQDLSFHNMYPYRCDVLTKAIRISRERRHKQIEKIHEAVLRAFEKNGIHAEIYGREKNLYGIYKRMRTKNLPFRQVVDIYGFRVVVDTLPQCYMALGVLHALYKPIPGKVQDHIAMPKLNNYQSLHTSLIGPFGDPVEFQIRTREMHHVAESGITAHWMYKSDEETMEDLQKNSLGWLQSLLDIQQQTGNSAEFIENVKVDLLADSVYVFTPKSKIIALPRAATALDFAYNIHSSVGQHTASVKVNNAVVPLRTELQNGDIVEVITSPDAHPTPSWLEFVKTGKARSRIRSYLRSVNQADSIKLGKQLLQQSLRAIGLDLSNITKPMFDKMLYETGSKTVDDFYNDMGTGKRLAVLVSRRIAAMIEEEGKKAASAEQQPAAPQKAEPVIIYGSEGIHVELASCCLPIPGDTIIGNLNRATGLTVHTTECPRAKKLIAKEPDLWLPVDWGEDTRRNFDCYVHMLVVEEKGILARVTSEISGADANITAVAMEMQGEFNLFKFTLQVENRTHLASLLRRMRHVPGVKKVGRDHI